MYLDFRDTSSAKFERIKSRIRANVCKRHKCGWFKRFSYAPREWPTLLTSAAAHSDSRANALLGPAYGEGCLRTNQKFPDSYISRACISWACISCMRLIGGHLICVHLM